MSEPFPAASFLGNLRRAAFCAAFALLGTAVAVPAFGEQGKPPDDEKTGQQFGVEIKGHYRDSDSNRFPSPFIFPSNAVPVGQPRAFLETVDAGAHTEVSVVTLWYQGQWENGFSTKVKLDLIDQYDRNPTSADHEYDLDEAWIRWGEELEPGEPHEGFSFYAKLGKIPKFERQDDRHLETYGLVSTAFNRMEDVGLEYGFDLGRHFYLKSSVTQGNPVFIRDPTSLAGDNGIDELNFLLPGFVPNPNPRYKSGQVIFYDADVDEIDFSNPEAGLGIGGRLNDPDGSWSVDVMVWGFRRDLAESVDLDGTFYHGDIDLLLGPSNRFPLPITNGIKEEIGANLWVYAGAFTFFGQYVDQDLAGLPRKGFEVEAAYEIELPYFGALFGRQVFPYIAPAIRYSELEPRIPQTIPPSQYPAVSVRWPWEKTDYGLRIGLLTGLDLTLEYCQNEFLIQGNRRSNDEMLATLRFNWDWRR